MRKLSPKQANLLSILVTLNAWEQKNSASLHTQSGRSLYFQLAQVLLAPVEGDGVSMKQRLGDASERSMRDHMRSFQEAGLLTEKTAPKTPEPSRSCPPKSSPMTFDSI
jgi:DNA-binding HxlR family transcriptional regulator